MKTISWAGAKGRAPAWLLAEARKHALSINKLTVADLVADGGRPHSAMTGLYFIFDGRQLAYIGKAGSKSFAERVPGHFDLRPGAWFNTFLKKYTRTTKPSARVLRAAVPGVFLCRVALLPIPVQTKAEKQWLGRLETALRAALQPTLNPASMRIQKRVGKLKSLARV